MYLTKLRLQNVKRCRNLSLDFAQDGRPRMMTVLIGPNAVCKTTILQSIGLCAVSNGVASALANVASLRDRRSGAEGGPARLAGDFEFGDAERDRLEKSHAALGLEGASSELSLAENHVQFVATSQAMWSVVSTAQGKLGGNAFLSECWSSSQPVLDPVLGYGVGRSLPAPARSQPSAPLAQQQLLPLFRDEPIIATGFADILESSLSRAYAKMLEAVLRRTQGLLPGLRKLELRGRGGIRTAADLVEGHRFEIDHGGEALAIPATWLSQGYQAIIAWISDIIGQFFLRAGAAVPLDAMRGIVLVDEIDLHLHPMWQIGLIPAMKAAFPGLQFVVSTHSPLVLAGCSADEVLRLELDAAGNVVVRSSNEPPEMMTGTELYRSYFGIERLYPGDLGDAWWTYTTRSRDAGRSDADEARLQAAIKLLRASDVGPIERPVARRRGGEP